jgi:hypothetical protein
MSRHETGFQLTQYFKMPKTEGRNLVDSSPPAKGRYIGTDGREHAQRRSRPTWSGVKGQLVISTPS